jgi:hypothetical protein
MKGSGVIFRSFLKIKLPRLGFYSLTGVWFYPLAICKYVCLYLLDNDIAAICKYDYTYVRVFVQYIIGITICTYIILGVWTFIQLWVLGFLLSKFLFWS